MGNGVIEPKKLTEHREKYGATYVINLFGSVIPIIMFLVYANQKIDNVATDIEVANLITDSIVAHEVQSHEELEGKVDQLYLLNLQQRIEQLIRAECNNPNLRSALEPEINSLIRDYNSVSLVPYQRPSCTVLRASNGA